MTLAAMSDNAALRTLASAGGGALCTIVGMDGSYSRRLGAQLAILPDGSKVGSLADGCLEAQLEREAKQAVLDRKARLLRFGSGSPMIDFRLPCGSGLDILIDPHPDIAKIRCAVADLDNRQPARLSISLPEGGVPFERRYRPEIRLVILGSGPECQMLFSQAEAFGISSHWLRPRDRSGGELGFNRLPDITIDHWTAIALLFHDHEWESALLPWALRSDACYIGAQGGAKAREDREAALAEAGLSFDQIGRLRAPIGLIPHAREPSVLALSILSEIVADFEQLY